MTTPLIGTNLNIAYSIPDATTGEPTTWNYFGYAKNCKLKKSRKTIEVSSPTTGDSECYIPGRKGWTMSSSGLTPADFSAIDQIYEAGTEIYLQMRDITPNGKDVENYAYKGKAIIKGLDHSGDIHQMGKTSISLQGTGALTYSKWSETITYTAPNAGTSTKVNVTITLSKPAPCAVTLRYNNATTTGFSVTFQKGQTTASVQFVQMVGKTYDPTLWAVSACEIGNYHFDLQQD